MPFLRVLRDKRGYETTYLVHWFREGTRQRSRILYVFRTPPGVRVGCKPFEADVMQELEASYPEIAFDWRALVENQQVVEPPPERRARRRRDSEEVAQEPASDDRVPSSDAPVAPAPAISEPARSAPGAPAMPRLVIPAAIEGSTPAEKMEWLRAWYPRIREYVPHRTHDPARREALLALTDRLNPEAWTDDAAMAAGLGAAAEALQRLSQVFSRRRRRSRRPARSPGSEAPPSEN